MVTIAYNGQKPAYGLKHYIVDTEADLSTINLQYEIMGTTAFVINTSTYYMVNGAKQWSAVNLGNNGGALPSAVIYEGGNA